MSVLLVALVAAAPGASLSFDEVLGLAQRTPAVQGAQRAVTAKRALDAKVSRLTLNPTLTVQPGWRFYPAQDRQYELVVELVQPWNIGHGTARKRAIALEEQALDADVRARALEQRLAAARTWIDVWAAQRVKAAAERELRVAEELQRLVEKAAALGAATRADVADARAFSAEARLAVVNAEGETFERGLDLGREVAAATAAPVAAAGDLPEPALPPRETWPSIIARAQTLPAVATRLLETRAERARTVEERAARGTILQLGAVVLRDSPGGLVVSGLLRLTPPIWDHGERERAVMAANAERLAGAEESTALAARTDVAMAAHDVDHSNEILVQLRDQLVPASREGADARRRIFQAGEATLLEVLQSERIAISAEARLERARALNAWARVKLWLLLTAMVPR